MRIESKRRAWSDYDVKLLQDNWGYWSLKKICKKLNRSEKAVRSKAWKIGLMSESVNDKITLRQLLYTLGYGKNNSSSFYKKYINLGLPVTIVRNKKNKIYYISIDKFWEWLYDNKNALNISKLEKNALGIEPSWVDQKRRIDCLVLNKSISSNTWSKEEDNLLICKAKSGYYTIIDLSLEFNRTQTSVYCRLLKLNLSASILKRVPKKKWNKKELDEFIYLLINGYNKFYIANKFYITMKSFHCLINKLIKEGVIKHSLFVYLYS